MAINVSVSGVSLRGGQAIIGNLYSEPILNGGVAERNGPFTYTGALPATATGASFGNWSGSAPRNFLVKSS